MLHAAWSFDKGDFPPNVLKAWMRIEVQEKNFDKNLAIKANAVEISHPEFPYYSSQSAADYKLEITRDEGPDDIWKLKFDYQFGVRRNPESTKFRGSFNLRSLNFGTWEPFYHSTFVAGSVHKTKDATGKSLYSFKIQETLKTQLSTHFVPIGNSTRGLEAQLLIEFCDHSVKSQIEMEAGFASRNYIQAIHKTDCTIKVNKHVFHCHSAKIKSMSNVWERLFEHGGNPSAENRITRDWSEYFTSHRAMQIFLRFVYYQELPATRTSFQYSFDLLKFAHMFNITTLERGSELLILENKNIQTIEAALGFQIYSFARNVDALGKLKNLMCVVLKRNARMYKKEVLLKFAKEDTESFVEVFQCDDKDKMDSDESMTTDGESSEN